MQLLKFFVYGFPHKENKDKKRKVASFLFWGTCCYAPSTFVMTSSTSKVIVPSSSTKSGTPTPPFSFTVSNIGLVSRIFKKAFEIADAVGKVKKEIADPFGIQQCFCIYTVFAGVCSINHKFQNKDLLFSMDENGEMYLTVFPALLWYQYSRKDSR